MGRASQHEIRQDRTLISHRSNSRPIQLHFPFSRNENHRESPPPTSIDQPWDYIPLVKYLKDARRNTNIYVKNDWRNNQRSTRISYVIKHPRPLQSRAIFTYRERRRSVETHDDRLRPRFGRRVLKAFLFAGWKAGTIVRCILVRWLSYVSEEQPPRLLSKQVINIERDTQRSSTIVHIYIYMHELLPSFSRICIGRANDRVHGCTSAHKCGQIARACNTTRREARVIRINRCLISPSDRMQLSATRGM